MEGLGLCLFQMKNVKNTAGDHGTFSHISATQNLCG